MLAPIKHLLGNYRIVLASGSPRRQELVKMLVGYIRSRNPSKT